MTLVIRILFFCILSSLVQSQEDSNETSTSAQSMPNEETSTTASTETTDNTNNEVSQTQTMTNTEDTSETTQAVTESPETNNQGNESGSTTTIVDCTSAIPQTTTCPPCPTLNTQPTPTCSPCPTITTLPELTCTPCPTITTQMTTTCDPCPTTTTASPISNECPVCQACPACEAVDTKRTNPMTPKDVCDHLNGNYEEQMCHYKCTRPMPYTIIFTNYKTNGEECWMAGQKGNCQQRICTLPRPPGNWW